jgi:hypothetical protein
MNLAGLTTALVVVFASREAALRQAQGLDEASLNAMVQIVATRNGDTVRGSGFIIALDRERSIATILTSAHVIEGTIFQAIFSADSVQSPRPTDVVGIDSDNRNGLAVFRVRAAPPGATVLEIAKPGEPGPRPGQWLTLVGYPSASVNPFVKSRTYSGQEGSLYVIDQGVPEGSSGGPVILDGKVVGVVTATTGDQTYAVPFSSMHTFVQGYRSISLVTTPPLAAGPRSAAPPPPGPDKQPGPTTPSGEPKKPGTDKPGGATAPSGDPEKPTTDKPAGAPTPPAESGKPANDKPAGAATPPGEPAKPNADRPAGTTTPPSGPEKPATDKPASAATPSGAPEKPGTDKPAGPTTASRDPDKPATDKPAGAATPSGAPEKPGTDKPAGPTTPSRDPEKPATDKPAGASTPPADPGKPLTDKPAGPTTPSRGPEKPAGEKPSGRPMAPPEPATASAVEAARKSSSAMVTVTGTVDGAPFKASGFVVALRRDLADVYVATSRQFLRAQNIQVTFAVDRGHTLPARYSGEAKSDTGEDGIYVLKIDSAGPAAATALAIADAVPPTSRTVLVVAAADGSDPEIVERRYLGRDITASFFLKLDGSVGSEFIGGPVLFDGKVGGLIIRSADGRTVAYGADVLRQILGRLNLIEPLVK